MAATPRTHALAQPIAACKGVSGFIHSGSVGGQACAAGWAIRSGLKRTQLTTILILADAARDRLVILEVDQVAEAWAAAGSPEGGGGRLTALPRP